MVIATCLSTILWNLAFSFVSPQSVEQRLDLITTIAQIVGGLVLASGLYFTARTYLSNREGQITERFSRAIDQLGNDDLPVRLGGIYALERIARDSPRDQRQIVEILTTFVREAAPVLKLRSDRWGELQRLPPKTPFMSGLWPYGENTQDDVSVSAAVQAILSVLGRREPGTRRGEPFGFNLSFTDLRRVNWVNAHLPNVQLIGSDLEGTWFKGSDLSGATFTGSNISSVAFAGAKMRGVALDVAYASSASFTEVDLRDAHLYKSNFQWASFWNANLTGVQFNSCNLDHTSFSGASLVRTLFNDASLVETNFSGSDLTMADLRGIDLRQCAGLTRDQVAKAVTNHTTLLPPDLPEQDPLKI